MSEENKALVQRYYGQVMNGRDLDAVGDYFADERMVERRPARVLLVLHRVPGLHISLEELIAEGDKVFLRTTFTGTHDGEYKGIPPTGRHVASESAEIYKIADGKFVGYWCLSNVAGLMRQLTEEPALQAATATS